MRWGRFLAFCAGLALLGALGVVLTGHGLLIRQTITPTSETSLSCDYLTLRGVVTKGTTYGDFNLGRWNCPWVIDPSKPW